MENTWQQLTAQPSWRSRPNVNIMPLINIIFIALGKGFQGRSSQLPTLERTIFIFLSAVRGSAAGTGQFREGEAQDNKVWRFPPIVCFSSAFWDRWNLRWGWGGWGGRRGVEVIISLSWYVIRQKEKRKKISPPHVTVKTTVLGNCIHGWRERRKNKNTKK